MSPSDAFKEKCRRVYGRQTDAELDVAAKAAGIIVDRTFHIKFTPEESAAIHAEQEAIRIRLHESND